MQQFEVKTGDLVELGQHRLVCGDCSKPEDLRLLFIGNEKINTIMTDAPYGVGYVEGKKDYMEAVQGKEGAIGKFKAIKNDGAIQDYYAFSVSWLKPAAEYLAPVNTFYMFNGDAKMREFLNALHECGYHFSQLIVWDKNQSVMGRKDFQPMHELIFYGWKGKHRYYGTKDKSILRFPKPQKNKLHPTMKPPALLRRLLHHGTLPGDVVFEPFAGSGSTMISCEQLGRKCRMIEIEPEYCVTIIERYLKHCEITKRKSLLKVNGVELQSA